MLKACCLQFQPTISSTIFSSAYQELIWYVVKASHIAWQGKLKVNVPRARRRFNIFKHLSFNQDALRTDAHYFREIYLRQRLETNNNQLTHNGYFLINKQWHHNTASDHYHSGPRPFQFNWSDGTLIFSVLENAQLALLDVFRDNQELINHGLGWAELYQLFPQVEIQNLKRCKYDAWRRSKEHLYLFTLLSFLHSIACWVLTKPHFSANKLLLTTWNSRSITETHLNEYTFTSLFWLQITMTWQCISC